MKFDYITCHAKALPILSTFLHTLLGSLSQQYLHCSVWQTLPWLIYEHKFNCYLMVTIITVAVSLIPCIYSNHHYNLHLSALSLLSMKLPSRDSLDDHDGWEVEWDDLQVNFLLSNSVYFTFNIVQKPKSACCPHGYFNLLKLCRTTHHLADLIQVKSWISKYDLRATSEEAIVASFQWKEGSVQSYLTYIGSGLF